MAYATIEELAADLRIRVTPENTAKLQACLDAAAVEIDHEVDWLYDDEGELVAPPADTSLLRAVNLQRGIEWWKANDSAFGLIGFDESGALTVPRDAFARHAYTLTPHKQQWGIA